MSENVELSKFLQLARTAREEGNSEDAKLYYGKVREEDPQSAEAKYFYSYYCLYEGTNGELPKRFSNLCTVVSGSVKLIKNSNAPMNEQMSLLKAIVENFVPETWSENRYMNKKNHEQKVGDSYVEVFKASAITSCSKEGMQTLKNLGDQIESMYNGQPEAMAIAVLAWKEYVTLSQKWYAWAVKGDAEAYAEKIKKVEPSYEMPKKAGCISLADKR